MELEQYMWAIALQNFLGCFAAGMLASSAVENRNTFGVIMSIIVVTLNIGILVWLTKGIKS